MLGAYLALVSCLPPNTRHSQLEGHLNQSVVQLVDQDLLRSQGGFITRQLDDEVNDEVTDALSLYTEAQKEGLAL